MKETVLSYLSPSCPFRGSLHYYPTLDSTNTQAKTLAKAGAPHGTVVIAGCQSGGRGRMGRQFASPAGSVYLSVILRPDQNARDLMALTCAAAVAACDAVEKVSGKRPGVKWINDLVLDKKKLGGILTEMSIDPAMGLVQYAVIGIGINCRQIPEEVADLATCLDMPPEPVCAALIEAFSQMPLSGTASMQQYKKDCITLGQTVKIAGTDTVGTAVDVTDEGALVLELDRQERIIVSSGEVSVRGLYGYV